MAASRNAVLVGDAAAVPGGADLPHPREPDCNRGAVRALTRSDRWLCRPGLARPRGVLRFWCLHGRADRQGRLGRADHRAPCGCLRRHGARLSDELHHRAHQPLCAHHGDARALPLALRSRQQGALAHRRRRRPAGRSDVAAARDVSLRPLRAHRFCLFAGRAVRLVSDSAPADQFTVRALASRHSGKRAPHAGDRLAEQPPKSGPSTSSPGRLPELPAVCWRRRPSSSHSTR